MKQPVVLFLFSIYSYLSNLLFLLMELLPPFLRNLIYRLALKKMGRHVMIDYRCYLRYPSRISIGNNVAINRGCEFYPSLLVPGGEITLGSNVTLSPNVKLYAIGHDPASRELKDISGPIVIEDGAWLAAGVTVLPNVKIGRGAVIAAGAVVARDIPPDSIAAGIPAIVIKPRLYE